MTLGAIGWTVVHSLWQGTFIAGVAAMAFGLMRTRSAHARYLAGCICLALMVVLPAATAFTSLRPLRASLAPRLMPVVDAAVDLPTFAWWASVLVPIVGGLWLVAVAVRTVSVAREFRRSRTLRRFMCSPAAPSMRAMTADLAAQMRIRCPDVRTNPDATVPMVLGWRQPVILLPADMETWLRPDQIRAVLAHELEHVRRNDYPVNALQVAADTLLVHHPAARWLSSPHSHRTRILLRRRRGANGEECRRLCACARPARGCTLPASARGGGWIRHAARSHSADRRTPATCLDARIRAPRRWR